MIKDINEYLIRIASTSQYIPVTYSGDKENTLNRWLISSVIIEKDGPVTIHPHLNEYSSVLSKKEASSLEQEELERHWRYYISDHQESFYKLSFPEKLFTAKYDKNQEKYIYCLSSIYCEIYTNTIFHISTNMPTPIRVWINGSLVFTGTTAYFRKNHILSVCLSEGINTVLVERKLYSDNRILSICHKYFCISTIPSTKLLSEQVNKAFLDNRVLGDNKQAYVIFPDKAFYKSDEVMKIIVLPRCFNNQERQHIKVCITNSQGKTIKTVYCQTAEVVSMCLENTTIGVVYISVKDAKSNEKTSGIYVFRGDFMIESERLVEKASERKDCSKKILENFIEVTKIIDTKTGFVRGSSEIAHENIYYQVFKLYHRFNKYIDTTDSNDEKMLSYIYGNSFIEFDRSSIDGGFFSYSINLPKTFDISNKYPLIIYFMFDDNLIRYPVSPYRIYQYESNNAVVMSLSARADFSRDFINENDIIKAIKKVTENYCIDIDRIHLIGVCTGARRGFDLALKLPDLFASITACSGAIVIDSNKNEELYIKNIENIVIDQLMISDDYIYNGISIERMIHRLPNKENFIFNSFEHEEFIDLFNSPKLINRALKRRREKYPKKTHMTSYEPIYNKSYWLQMEDRFNLCEAAYISGEIQSNSRIDILTQNIKSFYLYINKEAMNLEDSIEICVNGQPFFICIDNYCILKINDNNCNIDIQKLCFSQVEFEKRYDFIGINENLLGVKQLFLDKCLVIRGNNQEDILLDNFYRILLQPLKMRARSYKYTLAQQNAINYESNALSNHIYVLAPEQLSKEQQEFLATMKIEISENAFVFHDNTHIGNYFTFVKIRSHYNEKKYCLFIIYSNKTVLEELNNFMRSFDTNPLFYSDLIVYNENRYYYYKI